MDDNNLTEEDLKRLAEEVSVVKEDLEGIIKDAESLGDEVAGVSEEDLRNLEKEKRKIENYESGFASEEEYRRLVSLNSVKAGFLTAYMINQFIGAIQQENDRESVRRATDQLSSFCANLTSVSSQQEVLGNNLGLVHDRKEEVEEINEYVSRTSVGCAADPEDERYLSAYEAGEKLEEIREELCELVKYIVKKFLEKIQRNAEKIRQIQA